MCSHSRSTSWAKVAHDPPLREDAGEALQAGRPHVGRSDEAQIAAGLVLKIRRGDPVAEGAMVERYTEGLLSFLRRRTRDSVLAEDLHQEVFRIVILRLRDSDLDQPEKLAAFLIRTADNLFIGHARKVARRKTEADSEAASVVQVPAGQHDDLARRERAQFVRRLLSELEPERDRELLFRFYLAEQLKEQVCAELGLSPDHFKRALYRARQRFKDLLERSSKRGRLRAAGRPWRPRDLRQ